MLVGGRCILRSVERPWPEPRSCVGCGPDRVTSTGDVCGDYVNTAGTVRWPCIAPCFTLGMHLV